MPLEPHRVQDLIVIICNRSQENTCLPRVNSKSHRQSPPPQDNKTSVARTNYSLRNAYKTSHAYLGALLPFLL